MSQRFGSLAWLVVETRKELNQLDFYAGTSETDAVIRSAFRRLIEQCAQVADRGGLDPTTTESAIIAGNIRLLKEEL